MFIWFILFLAAIVPPLYLVKRIYQKDRIEKESFPLIRRLFFFGVLSSFPAIVLEGALEKVFEKTISNPNLYLFAEVFIGVALVEEGCKYFFLRLGTWKSREFDYMFDGVVYSTTLSLGFAALENILYVFSAGFGIALIRALLSIPGHCIFGIWMGEHYSLEKRAYMEGRDSIQSRENLLCLLVPVLLHGIFDYCLFFTQAYEETDEALAGIAFVVFIIYVVILDIISIRKVGRLAKEDRPMLFERFF